MTTPICMIMEILPHFGQNFHIKRMTNLSVTLQWAGAELFDFARYSRVNVPHYLLDVRDSGWIVAWRLGS
jgi:hypothetical protein